MPDGTYYLLVEVIDPTGAASLTATTQTVQVASAFIQPSVSVGAVAPSAIAVGKSGSISVTVTNAGNVAAGGVQIVLSPSADGVTPLVGIILDSVSSGAKILPNKSKTFRLHFKLTSALAAGNYDPYVAVSLGGTSTTAVGSQFVVA